MSFKKEYLLFVLFLPVLLRGQMPPPVRINDDSVSVNLSGHLSYFMDAKGDVNLAEILSSSQAKSWVAYPSDYLQTGYLNVAHWFRFDLKAETDAKEDWYFCVKSAVLQDAQFYLLENDSLVQADTMGINFPYPKWKIQERYPTISMRPEKGKKLTIVCRLYNKAGSMKGYAELNRKSRFQSNDLKESVLYIAFYTFLSLATVICLALWLFWRERIYLYLAAYILFSLVMSAAHVGFAFVWLWPNSPWMAFYSRGVWACGVLGFFTQFVVNLLFEERDKTPLIRRTVLISSVLYLIYAALPCFDLPKSSLGVLVTFANSTFFVSLIFIFTLLIISIKKNKLTAYYFLFAFTPLIIVGMAIILHNNRIFPNVLGQSEVPFVFAQIFEIFFLFVSLMKRFQVIKINQEKQGKVELENRAKLQDERERISRDLHDNIGSQLSFMVRNIEQLTNGSLVPKKKSQEQLIATNETAKQVISTLRESIWVLNRETISIEDFTDRFKKYAFKHVKSVPNLKINFKEDIKFKKSLKPEQALQIQRILQEALNNCLKYSNATEAIFSIIAVENNRIYIQLKDNGIGFNFKQYQSDLKSNPDNTDRGYGLQNMNRRAKEIEATLLIESEITQGTSVSISLELV